MDLTALSKLSLGLSVFSRIVWLQFIPNISRNQVLWEEDCDVGRPEHDGVAVYSSKLAQAYASMGFCTE